MVTRYRGDQRLLVFLPKETGKVGKTNCQSFKVAPAGCTFFLYIIRKIYCLQNFMGKHFAVWMYVLFFFTHHFFLYIGKSKFAKHFGIESVIQHTWYFYHLQHNKRYIYQDIIKQKRYLQVCIGDIWQDILTWEDYYRNDTSCSLWIWIPGLVNTQTTYIPNFLELNAHKQQFRFVLVLFNSVRHHAVRFTCFCSVIKN